MSLLDRIKRFAEARRAMLMESLKEDKEADTTKVQWKGYNSDGYPIIKDKGIIETAKGQGLISNNPNKSMIYDKTGTVEYPKRKEIIDTRYQKPKDPIKPPEVSKKKTAGLLGTSSQEFGLAIIKKKEVAIDVICIAVIDENDNENTDAAWAAFRQAYPSRRFFLLQPISGYDGELYVPSAFGSDARASHQIVSAFADWYVIAGLDHEPIGAQCILFIDQSGSMDINTVLSSYNLFKSKALARANKVAVVDNADEDYIAPFYISDDTFRTDNYQSNWPQ